jgi:hypothetical protein
MPVRLILGLHNHQPVGNFDSVFAQAHAEAYRPFLDLIAAFPRLSFVLHTSGSLLEWLQRHRPDYVRDLKALVQRGQVEILGGAYFEPILPMLPRRDRQGQIRRYSAHLRELLGVEIRGMWLAERVWEPGLVADLVDAGIQYTLLDDYHFRQAGVAGDQLFQPFLTEDEGRLLKVFPISEPLRYLVPWKQPAEAVRYLVQLHEAQPQAVVVCADDGEKFGGWPGTHKLCFTQGWLKEFLTRLMDETSRGTVCVQTLAQSADQSPAAPLIYLPDCSYREMTEWALPVQRQLEYQRCVQEIEALAEPAATLVKSFLRGGLWRNFRVKYPEAREMYARMLEVSAIVARALERGHPRAQEAELELYRAQCNCAYWHGAFGGLYLPHLRHAVYEHLIAADNLLLEPELAAGKRVVVAERDFDLDGCPEVSLANDKLALYLAPSRGGALYELDVRRVQRNLQASLARRREVYHETVRQSAEGRRAKSTVSLVEDQVAFKQEGLERMLGLDPWPPHSLRVRCFSPETRLAESRGQNVQDLSDFGDHAFEYEVTHDPAAAVVTLRRAGQICGCAGTVTKKLELRAGADSFNFGCRLQMKPGMAVRVGIEFVIAGLAAGQQNRYFVLPDRPHAGPLETPLDAPDTSFIALVDEWLRLKATLRWDRPAHLWAWPQQTVSQSEGGFEAVHQGNILLPHWPLTLDAEGGWEVNIECRFECLASP